MKIATLLLAVCLATPALAVDRQTLIDQTNFSVNGNCSATLIDNKEGVLLTANHCVADMYEDVKRDIIDDKGIVEKKTVRIRVPGVVYQIEYADHNEVKKSSYNFDVLKQDDQKDLATIKVRTSLGNKTASKIACTSPKRGDKVWTSGNPFGILYASYSEGVVASIDRPYETFQFPGKGSFIQSTAPIAPGSSGGALYNDKDELIGVTVRGQVPFSGFNLAVPTEDIRSFLEMKACD